MKRDYAMDYPQLMCQAMDAGYTDGQLRRLKSAYDLAVRLVDGYYRGQGTPFRGNYPYRESIERDGKLILELAKRSGRPQLVSELEAAFHKSMTSALPEAVQTGSKDAFELPGHRDLKRGALITMIARVKRKVLAKQP